MTLLNNSVVKKESVLGLGRVMIDLQGCWPDEVERDMLRHPQAGALILFSRNYEDHQQLVELVKYLRSIKPELLIGVDHEGGRVQRFRQGFSEIPAMGKLGMLFEKTPEEAVVASKSLGWLMAAELAEVGIDFSFAPVLDFDRGFSRVIGDRGFGGQSDQIITLAGAFMAGMSDAGMASTGKHFPGHGGVEADSHVEIPVDTRSMAEIEEDIKPFARLIEQGLDAIMPAHVIYESVNPSAAGFSPYWLQSILREKLGFKGVIFSDDLSMQGASVAGGYAQRAQSAIDAGCDMVLVCNQPDHAGAVLESAEPWDKSVRLIGMAGKGLNKSVEGDEVAFKQAQNWIERLGAF